jgi:hypothetical protein
VIVVGAGSGVEAQDVKFAAAFGNRIRNNRKLGIDVLSNAVREPNDAGDADIVQNFPAISAFSLNAGTANIGYTIDTAPANAVYPLRVDFYKANGDEGAEYLGSDSYTSAQAQTLKNIALPPPNGLSISADDVVIATAADAEFSQSEFSFYPISLTIETPVPSACGGNVRIFCDAFENDPQRSLEVRARGSSTLFKPNGVLQLSDDRGATCRLRLVPIATALTSAGSCVLAGSGTPGAITITAVYDTFSGAFGNSATGGNVTQSTSFTIPGN